MYFFSIKSFDFLANFKNSLYFCGIVTKNNIKPMFNIFKKRNDNRRGGYTYDDESQANGFTDPDDFPTDGLDNSGW